MSGFTENDRKMLTDTYREVGEVGVEVKNIKSRLDRKDHWILGIGGVALAGFLNWFK